MEKLKILCAEDDLLTAAEIKRVLEENNLDVTTVGNGNEACEKYGTYNPDVVVLDMDMPGQNGLEVLQFIRLNNSRIPVIIYSTQTEEINQIKGLETGANVYITKEYSPAVLYSQIRRVTANTHGETILLGHHSFYHFTTRCLQVNAEVYKLTALESRVIGLLCQYQNQLVQRHRLLIAGWDSDNPSNEQQLNKLIGKFRKIIEPDPTIIIFTDKARGYRLQVHPKYN